MLSTLEYQGQVPHTPEKIVLLWSHGELELPSMFVDAGVKVIQSPIWVGYAFFIRCRRRVTRWWSGDQGHSA